MPRSVIFKKKKRKENRNSGNKEIQLSFQLKTNKKGMSFISKRSVFKCGSNKTHNLFLFLGFGLSGVRITGSLPFQGLLTEKRPWWYGQL